MTSEDIKPCDLEVVLAFSGWGGVFLPEKPYPIGQETVKPEPMPDPARIIGERAEKRIGYFQLESIERREYRVKGERMMSSRKCSKFGHAGI